MEEINQCPVNAAWASETALRDQFAENVFDLGLHRELKRVIRQDTSMSFFDLRKEALLWAEDCDITGERGRRVANTCGVEAEPVDANAVTAVRGPSSDPSLSEILEMLRKQQAQLDDVTRKLAGAQMTNNRSGVNRYQHQPRFDPSGRPICFKCQGVGHIARNCQLRSNQVGDPQQTRSDPIERVGHVNEQQGNFFPLWRGAESQEGQE